MEEDNQAGVSLIIYLLTLKLLQASLAQTCRGAHTDSQSNSNAPQSGKKWWQKGMQCQRQAPSENRAQDLCVSGRKLLNNDPIHIWAWLQIKTCRISCQYLAYAFPWTTRPAPILETPPDGRRNRPHTQTLAKNCLNAPSHNGVSLEGSGELLLTPVP